jgi:hypothetical protein
MTNVVTLKRETYRTGQSWAIGDVLHQTENRMRSAHATHLGYPYNLVGYSAVPASWATISSTISAILMSARTMGRILAISNARPSPG